MSCLEVHNRFTAKKSCIPLGRARPKLFKELWNLGFFFFIFLNICEWMFQCSNEVSSESTHHIHSSKFMHIPRGSLLNLLKELWNLKLEFFFIFFGTFNMVVNGELYNVKILKRLVIEWKRPKFGPQGQVLTVCRVLLTGKCSRSVWGPSVHFWFSPTLYIENGWLLSKNRPTFGPGGM